MDLMYVAQARLCNRPVHENRLATLKFEHRAIKCQGRLHGAQLHFKSYEEFAKRRLTLYAVERNVANSSRTNRNQSKGHIPLGGFVGGEIAGNKPSAPVAPATVQE